MVFCCERIAASTDPNDVMMDLLCSAAAIVGSKMNVGLLISGVGDKVISLIVVMNHGGVPIEE